ncbi:MAG: cytochrome c [Verrucomicrobiota bacterium]|nr:cytochrome c [Verrucomicrobiota bacterium]
MRYILAIFLFLVVATLSIFGLKGRISTKPPIEIFPDMDRQAKFHPQESSALFADGRSDRPAVSGTVLHVTRMQKEYKFLLPKEHLYTDAFLGSGKLPDATFGRGFPTSITVTNDLMLRGQTLYNRYCAICHGESGNGNGVTKSFGMVATANLLDDRIRTMPEGEIFNTITNGKNTMLGYGPKVAVEDRWAIIAYLRALELSQNATVNDVPADKRKELGL